MKIRWTLNPETDAVPGAMIDPNDPAVVYFTTQVGGTLYRTARFVNGVLDGNFASELPPGNYFFSSEHQNEYLPGFRVDNASKDLVVSVTVDGTGPSDVLRIQDQGITLYPWPDGGVAQDGNRLPIVLNFAS